jgi:hypothetical protein
MQNSLSFVMRQFRFPVLGCERESSAGATSQRSRTCGTPARGVKIMARARTAHQPGRRRLVHRLSSPLLLLSVACWLNACGGGETSLSSGGATCIAGPAPAILTWDAVAGATGYRIYYGTTSGSYPQSQDAGSSTTLTVTGLSSGTTYYFVATAYDGATPPNESGFSNAVCKTIP